MQTMSYVSSVSKCIAPQDRDREVLKLAIRSLLLVWCQKCTPGERPGPKRLH
ncbi:MAG: hypothetical protein ACK4HW_12420 [Roseinatronobacter sp.]